MPIQASTNAGNAEIEFNPHLGKLLLPQVDVEDSNLDVNSCADLLTGVFDLKLGDVAATRERLLKYIQCLSGISPDITKFYNEAGKSELKRLIGSQAGLREASDSEREQGWQFVCDYVDGDGTAMSFGVAVVPPNKAGGDTYDADYLYGFTFRSEEGQVAGGIKNSDIGSGENNFQKAIARAIARRKLQINTHQNLKEGFRFDKSRSVGVHTMAAINAKEDPVLVNMLEYYVDLPWALSSTGNNVVKIDGFGDEIVYTDSPNQQLEKFLESSCAAGVSNVYVSIVGHAASIGVCMSSVRSSDTEFSIEDLATIAGKFPDINIIAMTPGCSGAGWEKGFYGYEWLNSGGNKVSTPENLAMIILSDSQVYTAESHFKTDSQDSSYIAGPTYFTLFYNFVSILSQIEGAKWVLPNGEVIECRVMADAMYIAKFFTQKFAYNDPLFQPAGMVVDIQENSPKRRRKPAVLGVPNVDAQVDK